jgi:hypothetical protein
MAVSASLLTANGTSTATTSTPTASITPPANQLIGVWICTDNGSPTSLSGCGLTWVQEILDTTLVPMALWRSMGASPSTGQITINLGANSKLSWAVIAYSGVDTTGTNGSGAIRAANDAHNTGSGVGSLQVTLPNAINAGNAVAGMFINGGSVAMTAGGSYTKLGETTASGFTDLAHEWNAAGTTTPSMSWSGTFNAAGIAAEIVAAGGGGGPAYVPRVFTSYGSFF